MEYGLNKKENNMIKYKINEEEFLKDYFAIEESRQDKILESESVLAELGDRIKRLKPETLVQIKADIYADIDKEIGEQTAFYKKYITAEEVEDIPEIDTMDDVCDDCVNSTIEPQTIELEQVVEPSEYVPVQAYSDTTDTVVVENVFTDVTI